MRKAIILIPPLLAMVAVVLMFIFSKAPPHRKGNDSRALHSLCLSPLDYDRQVYSQPKIQGRG